MTRHSRAAMVGRMVAVAVHAASASIRATPLAKASGIVRDYVLHLYYVVDDVPRLHRLWMTPLLLGVEYLVYRVDALAERNIGVDLDVERTRDYDTFHTYKRVFERVLRLLGAWNDDVARTLEEGERFIRMENGATSRGVAGRDEVITLVELRPTDVRLLHAMTSALRGRQTDPSVRDLLWPVEVLADIANDLKHYDRDVRTGALNVYAAFVRLHGEDGAIALRREVNRYDATVRDRLSRVPLRRRAVVTRACLRRYEAALAPYPDPIDPST